jgi:hypothetical protein
VEEAWALVGCNDRGAMDSGVGDTSNDCIIAGP